MSEGIESLKILWVNLICVKGTELEIIYQNSAKKLVVMLGHRFQEVVRVESPQHSSGRSARNRIDCTS